MSDPFVTLGKRRRVHVTGTPTNLRYKEKGQLIKRTGFMTLALHKAVDGWRIAAWAWADN